MIHKKINVDEIENIILNDELTLIDVSENHGYDKIKTLRIPLENDDFVEQIIKSVPKDKEILIYSSLNDNIDTMAASRIINSLGYEEVYEFSGNNEDLEELYLRLYAETFYNK